MSVSGGRLQPAIGAILGFVMCSGVAMPADSGQVATLDERIAGAERVVVATAKTVTPEWRENRHGDRLIVSRIQLEIEEPLKGGGTTADVVWMEMDGGTLDGLTLRVSTLPLIQRGERAVFFLDQISRGVFSPHLRGQGILSLDDYDLVRGSSLRLDEIRTRARVLAK